MNLEVLYQRLFSLGDSCSEARLKCEAARVQLRKRGWTAVEGGSGFVLVTLADQGLVLGSPKPAGKEG